MVCSKNHNNKPIEEFILVSPAPVDAAAKLSSIFVNMSSKVNINLIKIKKKKIKIILKRINRIGKRTSKRSNLRWKTMRIYGD